MFPSYAVPQGHISIVSPLDREGNSLLVILLEAADDGTDPGPRTGYASVCVTIALSAGRS